jgi:hypothetical protein
MLIQSSGFTAWDPLASPQTGVSVISPGNAPVTMNRPGRRIGPPVTAAPAFRRRPDRPTLPHQVMPLPRPSVVVRPKPSVVMPFTGGEYGQEVPGGARRLPFSVVMPFTGGEYGASSGFGVIEPSLFFVPLASADERGASGALRLPELSAASGPRTLAGLGGCSGGCGGRGCSGGCGGHGMGELDEMPHWISTVLLFGLGAWSLYKMAAGSVDRRRTRRRTISRLQQERSHIDTAIRRVK